VPSTDAKRAYLAGLLQQDVFPVSPAQKRLWIREQIDGSTAAHTLAVALRLRGALDVDALNRALAFVVERHDVLRTSFQLRNGDPVQVIGPFKPVNLPVVDVSEPQLLDVIQSEIRIPFELARGSLWRVTLYRLSLTDHVLVCAMHHIISDAWSLGILVRELEEACRAFSGGGQVEWRACPSRIANRPAASCQSDL
jgi:NRPS condensation-like uncharacterized protein